MDSRRQDRVVFLSDVHLADVQDARTGALLDLLAALPGRGATALYVLGDLFHAWTGPEDAARAGFASVLGALRGLAADGVRVTILTGNRDFMLGLDAGVPVVAGDVMLDLDGRRVLLTHGDRLCLRDTRYQAYRRLLRGPLAVLGAVLPPACRAAVAGLLRAMSSREVRAKPYARMDVSPRAVRALFRAGADVVVCGHVHRPRAVAVPGARPGTVLYTLGAWEDGPSYLEYSGGSFRLVGPGTTR